MLRVIIISALLAFATAGGPTYPAGVTPNECPNYPFCGNTPAEALRVGQIGGTQQWWNAAGQAGNWGQGNALGGAWRGSTQDDGSYRIRTGIDGQDGSYRVQAGVDGQDGSYRQVDGQQSSWNSGAQGSWSSGNPGSWNSIAQGSWNSGNAGLGVNWAQGVAQLGNTGAWRGNTQEDDGSYRIRAGVDGQDGSYREVDGQRSSWN